MTAQARRRLRCFLLVFTALAGILVHVSAAAICTPTTYTLAAAHLPSLDFTDTSGNTWTPAGGFPGCSPGDSAVVTTSSQVIMSLTDTLPNPLVGMTFACAQCELNIGAGGALVLAGSATFTSGAAARVVGGALTLAPSGSLEIGSGSVFLAASGTVDVQSGATLGIQSGAAATVNGASVSVEGIVTVAAGVTLVAETAIVLDAGTINGGGTLQNDGTLSGSGTLDVDVSGFGTLAPGTSTVTGVISINGTLSGSNDVNIKIASDTSFDLLEVSGNAFFGGILNVTILAPYAPTRGTYWQVLSYAANIGIFNQIQLPLDPALTSDFGANQLTIAYAAPPGVSVAFDQSSIALNGESTLTITLSNPNPYSTLSGVTVSDALPSTTGSLIIGPFLGVGCGGALFELPNTNAVAMSGVSLSGGRSCSQRVGVIGVAAGEADDRTNVVSSNEGGLGSTSNTAVLQIVAPPVLSMQFVPDLVPLNGNAELQFTISNPAANQIAEMFTEFTTTLPASFSTGNLGQNDVCGINGGEVGNPVVNAIDVEFSSLPVGSTCTFSLPFQVTSAGVFEVDVTDLHSFNGGNGAALSATLQTQSATLAATLTDSGGGYARAGQIMNYLLSISNPGPTLVSDISIAETLPPEIDAAQTQWICIDGGAGTACTPSGTGALTDTGVTIPVHRSLSWVISGPLATTAVETLDSSVSIETSADAAAPLTASDDTVLVLFRNGFDNSSVVGSTFASTAAIGTATQRTDALPVLLDSVTSGEIVTLPSPVVGTKPVEVVMRADAADGSGFRVEQLNLGATLRVRLVSFTALGAERAGAWISARIGAPMELELIERDGIVAALSTGESKTQLRVAAAASVYRIATGQP